MHQVKERALAAPFHDNRQHFLTASEAVKLDNIGVRVRGHKLDLVLMSVVSTKEWREGQ